MNPCPCGYYGDPRRACSCAPGAIGRYQLIYAPTAVNNQEELRLSVSKWNGNAVTRMRHLDAPIINMSLYNGKAVIATRKSLYYMGGQPDPGEAKDPDITNDTGRPALWIGDPEPIMSHGVFAEGDDFTFLESYRGRLYTWLGGRVAQFDQAVGEGRWARVGPEGTACYGACVAGDWLIVALKSCYGTYEAWGFDGEGWWLLLQRSSAGPAVMWPVPLAGAGNRDALLFRDGGGTYDLLRLRWRSSTLHTYATAGTWTSPLMDGGDPSANKAWRAIGATFAQPEVRGNSASVDNVSFPLEYSIDGGETWLVAASVDSTDGDARVFTREVAFPAPPESRLLQVRQRWESVDDWAPVLGGLWVESENAEEYALGELAQAAYEADLAAEGLLRRRWELTISASDRNVTRSGQVDAKTGRQAIAALWDAWELGASVTFQDIDNDSDPVTYLVAIVGMEEKAAKPADGARWGESTVTLMLEEGVAGAIAAPAGWFLDDLDDVTLGALADGHVLTYDSGTGRWGNEPSGGAHTHDLLYQPLDEDLTTLAAIADVEGDLLIRGASGWERLAKGAALQALRMNAGATRPEWGVGGLDFEFYMDANGAAAGPAIFDFFGANSAFPTEAGAVYEIVASLFFLKTTAGTATVTLTNTQAYTNLSGRRLQSAATGMAANGGLVGSAIVNDTLAASPHAASAALTTAVEHLIEARWRAQIGLAGNIRIRLTQSAGTATPLRGSFYTVRKLAGNVGSFVP